jgi:galactokinase
MTTPESNVSVEDLSARFRKTFGRDPRWIVAAPGRVNIIGEHIDYNDGFVLPMAIEHYCYITADEAADGKTISTLISASAKDGVEINVNNVKPHGDVGHWSNYFTGVIAGFNGRGRKPAPFDALVNSTVPLGGGLSSSASAEVAMATLMEVMTRTSLDPVDKALLCQRAEHEYAGVPCGIMDQFASAMGKADHLMLLDCRSRQVEHIPLTDPNVSVLITNTNVRHELSGGEYAERRGQCESACRKLNVSSLRDVSLPQLEAKRAELEEVEYRRARHAITEIARTVEAADAIKAGSWDRVGELMYASHESLRDDFEVSCAELDLLVELARKRGRAGGVIGSRMTGGGFGGCTVSLVEKRHISALTHELGHAYFEKTRIEPTFIVTRPARGAHVVKPI